MSIQTSNKPAGATSPANTRLISLEKKLDALLAYVAHLETAQRQAEQAASSAQERIDELESQQQHTREQLTILLKQLKEIEASDHDK